VLDFSGCDSGASKGTRCETSSEDRTGVTPLLTERRGPSQNAQGLRAWPGPSPSNLTTYGCPARCCFTDGGDIVQVTEPRFEQLAQVVGVEF
jgi:hypothetical protein